MWLRLALKLLPALLLFSACSPSDRQAADKLNSISYAYHYRNLDSTEHYANEALHLSEHYADGRAEALNNLAFVSIVKMHYDEAHQLLDLIPETTDNQLELLVAYVQQMRLCQRQSHNRAFYDYREQAHQALRRIGEERASLSRRQLARLTYAESELAIVTSTYYYYVGLERQSVEALQSVPSQIEADTMQHLNYLYNVGAGGIITTGAQKDINQTEFDHLMRCYLLAQQAQCPYFAANSLEALAEHLVDTIYARQLVADNLPAMKYLNQAGVADEALPAYLANQALEAFSVYGDAYQIAGAYRTLATCYRAQGDYTSALYNLEQALSDPIIEQAPDLVASIREQLSVAYAAIDDKASSDLNRNLYLDLQEQTRQDRSLEARASQLEHEAAQLNLLLGAVVGGIVLLGVLLGLSHFRRRRRQLSSNQDCELKELEDELQERLALSRLHLETAQRRNLEQRAKISLVNSITPLIDRMIHEIRKLDDNDEARRQERYEYIRELIDNINEQNDVLTHWIQLRQGELSLHIETFPLQQLFDIVGKSKMGFQLKGLELSIEPTEARVKADKVLTLFMLNTLADNARKFTPNGGRVSISAQVSAQYVEISVADTGIGMDADQLAHVFDRKMISDHQQQASHGFGLLNCKGIIEKYRKLSQIFSVCLLAAESQQGAGSRFYFRLPKGLTKLLAALGIMGFSLAALPAQGAELSPLTKASAYADSVFNSNVIGTYERTLALADSTRYYLNCYYLQQHPLSTDTMLRLGDPSVIPAEVKWYHDSLRINYDIILTIRNESAVAALALHRWQLYNYNNRIFTLLFKELSADSTLDEYCRKMQQSQTNKQIAIILLVLLLVSILLAVGWQMLISMRKAANRRQAQQARLEMAEDEVSRVSLEEGRLHVSNAVLDNCLSTLKHETMYYPSRIRQLIDMGSTESLSEVAHYYRELYGILSLQAMRQVELGKLHLQPLDHELLGDATLVGYLFELLRKQSGQRKPDATWAVKGERYVVCTVALPSLALSAEQAALLFTPQPQTIPFLLCRQIVRDHGEATNLRGCAIRAEVIDNVTTIIITLPRIWKTSKSSS